MTDLTKLRDELAAKYKDSVSDGTSLTEKTMFVYGWNALLSHLTEAAGEFSDAGLYTLVENRWPHTNAVNADYFVRGCAHQFEQNRARIGLAEWYKRNAELAHVENEQSIARAERAETRLAVELHNASVEADIRNELRNKLTASEAAYKKLEADHTYGIEKTKDLLAHSRALEARIKELEAENLDLGIQLYEEPPPERKTLNDVTWMVRDVADHVVKGILECYPLSDAQIEPAHGCGFNVNVKGDYVYAAEAFIRGFTRPYPKPDDD